MTKNLSEKRVLLISIFIAGLCSIIYELQIGTTSTYFLGDGVKYFSITIGVYMASMGLGSYLSRFIQKNLVANFIIVEIILAFFGGISVPLLYFLFSWDLMYLVGMLLCIIIIGLLTGFEIPLLSRILSTEYSLRENLSNVLSLDYVGALIATLCFPFIILPFIGLFKTSLVFGLINLVVAVMNIHFLSDKIKKHQRIFLKASIFIVFIFISLILLFSNILLSQWEQGMYSDRIISARQSPYQRIVLTKNKEDIRLYLDGNLQFSSIDEYRYHETLVHVPMSLINSPKQILILGGGDGLAARELLKYKSVEEITIVDLDEEVSILCKKNNQISRLNNNSLSHPKVNLINADAFIFVKNNKKYYDLIISDLPDPNNNSISRLYSKEFYHWISRSLDENGIFITQASSPVFSKKAFWCIEKTINSSNFDFSYPLHAYIPSFGDWGFVIASKKRLDLENIHIDLDLKFLSNDLIKSLFLFPNDQITNDIKISTLDKPLISKYYEEGWVYWK